MKEYKCSKCGKGYSENERSPGGSKRGGRVDETRRTFCSRKCYAKFWNTYAWQKRRPADVEKECPICKIKFFADRKHLSNQKCCSLPCRIKENHRIESERRKARRGSKFCGSPKCGKEFFPDKYAWGNQKYCSIQCTRRELQKAYRLRHPDRVKENYKRSKWGGTWLKAMERDSYTCQVCGEKNREKLLAHHLDGEGQTRSKNHCLENLQVVCLSCHGKIHHDTFLVRKDGKLYVRFGDKHMLVVE